MKNKTIWTKGKLACSYYIWSTGGINLRSPQVYESLDESSKSRTPVGQRNRNIAEDYLEEAVEGEV